MFLSSPFCAFSAFGLSMFPWSSVVSRLVLVVTLTHFGVTRMIAHTDKEIRRTENMVIKQERQGWDKGEKEKERE